MCGGIVLLPRWFKKVSPGTFREVPESDVPQSYIDREAEATAGAAREAEKLRCQARAGSTASRKQSLAMQDEGG